jgi:hypothetical protein
METTLSVINLLPSGKEQVAKFVRAFKDEILANNTDPLKSLVQLKYAEKTIAEILKDDEIDYHFLKEFLLYDKDEKVIVNGATLTQSEVGVKYKYPDCGDPVWNDLNKQIEELTEKKKEREKFLQNIPYDKGTVDPDTGLFITRPPKSSKTKVVVKL